MNIDMNVVVNIVAGFITIGVTYGVVKTTLKNHADRIKKTEDKLEELGNCDVIIRRYLFSEDGRTIYVPSSTCERSHEKLEETLKDFNRKMDSILEAILKMRE